MGNAGHPASLKPIMKILPGFGSAADALPIRVQVDAILALRSIAKKEPKLVSLATFLSTWAIGKNQGFISYCLYVFGLVDSASGPAAVHGQGSSP